MKKTSSKQKMKLQETLKDFKTLLPSYSEVQSSPILMKSFLSRNRNPLWDITNTKAFSTGLVSNGYISRDEETKVSVEHYIQRSLAMRIIFDELSKNPVFVLCLPSLLICLLFLLLLLLCLLYWRRMILLVV